MSGLPIEEEVNEHEVNFLQLKQVKNDTVIKVTETAFDPDQVPASANLLVVSNIYGYVIIGTLNGLMYGSTNALLSAYKDSAKDPKTIHKPRRHVRLPMKDGAVIRQLALSADELVVLIALSNGTILCIETSSLEYADKTSIYSRIELEGEIAYLLPNLEAFKDMCAVVMMNGQLRLFDIKPGTTSTPTTIDLNGEQAICACWSRRGKQIICGMKSGLIRQYTPTGELKREIACPPSLSQPSTVQATLWIETNVILAIYAPGPDENGEVDEAMKHDYGVYMISQASKGAPWCYRKMPDPCPPWGMLDRLSHFYFTWLKDWSSMGKHIICMANSPSTDIGIIGESLDTTEGWQVWLPADESDRAALPLPQDSMDTAPIGLALNTVLLEEEGAVSWPLLIVYTLEGTLVCYNVMDTKQEEQGQPCSLMQAPQPLPNTLGGTASIISKREIATRMASKSKEASVTTTSMSKPTTSATQQQTSNTKLPGNASLTAQPFSKPGPILKFGQSSSNSTTTTSTSTSTSTNHRAMGSTTGQLQQSSGSSQKSINTTQPSTLTKRLSDEYFATLSWFDSELQLLFNELEV
ncbi:hypothetical protein BDF19DRAFT_189250 [Syncephalis fuscata]|nr:hypothetical protein BDF19DRAFT_189250 [Syncephalis fuscata]